MTSSLLTIWLSLQFGLGVSAASTTIEAVTRSHPNAFSSAVGNGDSTAPVLSANGRFVAFVSDAGNLVTTGIARGPQYALINVFVRDLATGRTSLASVTMDGVNGGNNHSTRPVISADGRYVAFASDASNLVPDDDNNATDVFLRDMNSGTTTLISVRRGGSGSGNAASSELIMTPDGRFIAFVSAASNLTAGDINGLLDVFVRDVRVGTTTLVSVGARPGTTTLTESRSPSISDDGRFIAFFSTALGLVADVGDSSGHVYLRDVATGTTVWLSPQSSPDFPPFGISFNPVISANGRCVAFKTQAPRGITPTALFWHDRETGATVRVHDGVAYGSPGEPDNYGPILSADGQIVCYVAGQVYVWDAVSRTRTLVSVNRSGATQANATASMAAMDALGRRIAFVSTATDLVTNETHGAAQVYVRELFSGTTHLASVAPNGTGVLGDVVYPDLNADGTKLAFQTSGADLIEGDDNLAADVLVRDLANRTTQLVSPRDARMVPATANRFSTLNALSGDGRHILFTSLAGNLVPNDVNLNLDMFAADTATGMATLVSASPIISVSGSGVSFGPLVNPEGRYVAFASTATNLSTLDTNDVPDVYVRELQSSAITLVSVNRTGDGPGDGDSTPTAISADGRYVLFISSAKNLTGDASGSVGSVLLLRDLVTGLTTEIAAGLRGSGSLLLSANARSYVFQLPNSGNFIFRSFQGTTNEFVGLFVGAVLQCLSPDDRWIAFTRRGSMPTAYTLELFDRQTRQTVLLTDGRAGVGGTVNPMPPPPPIFSADGRSLVFSDASPRIVGGDTNNSNDVFVADLQGSSIRLVSINRTGMGTGNGLSDQPSISADGRFVAFRSIATDLTDDAPVFGSQVFLRDLKAGKTTLLSRSSSGQPGLGFSGAPLITPDGQAVVFRSSAENLAAGDFNNATDIFIARVSQTSSDIEFRVVLIGHDEDALKLSWPAQQGRNFTVQFKGNLSDAAWTDLPVSITVQGSTMSTTIPRKETRQGFYRVSVIP